jgi:hypothetical protein
VNRKNDKQISRLRERRVKQMIGAARVRDGSSALELGKSARRIPGRVETSASAELKLDRVAALDAKVLQWMARGREAKIEIGRAMNELKRILGHGRWKRHFAETFAPRGLSLRTAERYMKLAKAEVDSKIDKLALFKPAGDPQAVQVRNATEKAKTEADGAVRPLRGPKQIYKLALHLNVAERIAADKLWASSHRRHAEKKIIDLLKQLFIEFHIVIDEAC